ncbi:hypothetical protein [Acinetobacter sp. YH12103]|nr:hypothetical protein [Acinetobacter sp. YH12103]
METLKINLENCYGIGSFDYLFNFKVGEKNQNKEPMLFMLQMDS